MIPIDGVPIDSCKHTKGDKYFLPKKLETVE